MSEIGLCECGERAFLYRAVDDNDALSCSQDRCFVVCAKCEKQTAVYPTEWQAIKAWNETEQKEEA